MRRAALRVARAVRPANASRAPNAVWRGGGPVTRLLALALAALCFVFSADAQGDEPLPPEPDTNPEIYPRPSAQPNLLLIGTVLTATWYGAGVGVSYIWTDSPGAKPLRIPVAGPYMALAKTGCGDAERGCDTVIVVVRTILTSLSAVGQTGGVLAMVEGLFLPTRDNGRASHGVETAVPEPRITVAPVISGSDGLGVGLSGRF